MLCNLMLLFTVEEIQWIITCIISAWCMAAISTNIWLVKTFRFSHLLFCDFLPMKWTENIQCIFIDFYCSFFCLYIVDVLLKVLLCWCDLLWLIAVNWRIRFGICVANVIITFYRSMLIASFLNILLLFEYIFLI